MRITAPAKVNLTLRVLGKREDGYHALESVMQMVSLTDVITIDDADGLVFTCSDPVLETEENLVVRAARLMQRYSRVPRGAAIHLEKHIPMQAGLGGGSSDAATVLAALNEFWEIRQPMDVLATLAAELGSDVPFFLSGPTAVVRGRGEQVAPVLHSVQAAVVLAKPAAGLSTPEVYRRLFAGPAPAATPAYLPETTAMLRALQTDDIEALAATLVNDLAGPAFALLPALLHGQTRMLELGCLGAVLCGSGSAICGLCPDQATAEHAARDLRNDFPWTATARFITPPVLPEPHNTGA